MSRPNLIDLDSTTQSKSFRSRGQLRAEFAHQLSRMYGAEVPAYNTLVAVSQAVNSDCLSADPDRAPRLGEIARVTAERHGAIRVGTAQELAQVGRVFAALGMEPVGFYDLREGVTPIPVVSTAFRPIHAPELARNPFRVFVSVLTSDDRRFFSADLERRIESFLGRRQLFPEELESLAVQAETSDGLPAPDADRFLELAVNSFALSRDPVDAAWYRELEGISSVAADIAGVTSTHVNHLTPRVIDIDELYRRMDADGIVMIDEIQGPPRWDGPDVLLRQTSFRALDEPRLMREPDGAVREGALRVRFGEVESRGIALSSAGRDLVEELDRVVDDIVHASGQRAGRARVAADVWRDRFPRSETDLLCQELGYFTFEPGPRRQDRAKPPSSTDELVELGWLRASPIVYEDFLPRSAAGIFRSNLAQAGGSDASVHGSDRDRAWLAGALGRDVHEPDELYARQQSDSLQAALQGAGLAEAESSQ